MAKVLTEQPRRFSPLTSDPRQFGDGAPLHSAAAFDLVRWVNNLRSYREPYMQFLHDISIPGYGISPGYLTRIRFRIKGVVGDGACMLGQSPILVPAGATKLRWSLGLWRHPAAFIEGGSISLNVNTVTMYLSASPLRKLYDPQPTLIDADNECCRMFSEPDLTGPWTKNTVAAGATSNGTGDPIYTRVRSSDWTDFSPKSVQNLNDRTGDAWAFLIVTCAFTAGLTNESIRGAELSVWFEYEGSDLMWDDAIREACRNGKPAMSQVYRRTVAELSRFSRRARPLHNWWGGTDLPQEPDSEPQVRRIILTGSRGQAALGGVALALPVANALLVPKTGLVLNHSDADQAFAPLVAQSPGLREDINTPSTDWYPQYANTTQLFAGHVADYDPESATAREAIVQIGQTGVSYGPRLPSGLIFERTVKDKTDAAGVRHPVIGIEELPIDPYSTGSEILGAGSTDRTLADLRDMFNRLATEKSMHFGWNVCRNGSGTFGMNVTTGADPGQARYILNPAIGEGVTAPTVNGPGIEIPARFCGWGRETQVRAYFYFYAWMSTASGTGSFWIANRNNSGGMTGFSPLNDGVTVSGTTPQWYPALGAFDPVTAPNFPLNANPVYDTDNVVLAGMKGGSADLIVGAFAVVVRGHTV
jgi:hypothetical protein